MKLSVEQANILDKIVEKSRMDCWFSITDDLTSIHDVETNRNISLRYGIKELYEEYKEITVVDFDEDLDEIEME